jgi:hypothetical protein
VSDPDYLLSAMMDELLPQMIFKEGGNTKSRYADRLTIHRHDSDGNQAMTYDEKVKLFHAKRFLMPLRPLATKNWTVRDYIRYIDKHGRWCPESRGKGNEMNQDNW